MILRRCLPAVATLCAVVAPSARLAAQDAAGTSVRCESIADAYQRCPAAGTWRGARLVRQLSSSPCIQGRSWGFDRDAIWVNDGCRGVFDAGDRFASAGERVTCAGTGRTECPADTRYGVTLVRKLSQTSCVEGTGWGFGPSAVWVDRGCRAEFQMGSPPTGGPGGATTRTLTCGTAGGTQVTCRTGGYATAVRLVRDLSAGRCQQGENWGYTDAFIWASRGCRGEFLVTLQGDPETEQTGPTVISCGSTTGRQVVCDTEGHAVGVSLRRDQSDGSCRQGESWGFTPSFIWANQGCRGEFAVTYRDAAGPGSETARRITCGTSDRERLACRPGGEIRSARLLRDLGASRCRQHQSWGYGSDSLWVGGGCVGEFALTVGPGRGARTITCGSLTGQQMTCATRGAAYDVRLVSDLSGGRCREGHSWGHTNALIWASKGCRGRFAISYVTAAQPQ